MPNDSERVSRWRPGPGRLAQLLLGLWLFGIGEGLIVLAGLGNSPWTVLAQGVSLRTVMEILGHSQVALTANLYGHIYSEMTRDAADRMNHFFKSERLGEQGGGSGPRKASGS